MYKLYQYIVMYMEQQGSLAVAEKKGNLPRDAFGKTTRKGGNGSTYARENREDRQHAFSISQFDMRSWNNSFQSWSMGTLHSCIGSNKGKVHKTSC